ncbi:nuclease-related domain-containing protein, partial [Ectothiorhodospira lacustris]
MLIKHPDDHSHHAEALHELMESYPGQSAEIHRELLRLQLRESIHMFAELLEMQMDPLDETVVLLHDLRLEHEGRVVEIDHLLINRNLQITLVDSV